MNSKEKQKFKKVVVAIVQNSVSKVLVVERKDKEKGTGGAILSWQFPGGSVKHIEDLEVAVKRECKEETGYEVTVKEKISSRIHPQFPVEIYYYHCELENSERQKIVSSDISQAKWVNPDQLKNIFTSNLDDKVADFLKVK